MPSVCYDIISLSRKTLELRRCPCCQARLESSAAAASDAAAGFCRQAATPEVMTTVAHCMACGWWAVRERRLDNALYYPPVEDLVVMDAIEPRPQQPLLQHDALPAEQALRDLSLWQQPEPISSRDAVVLFGSAQMLLPGGGFSVASLLSRLKSLAPVLFPIVVIILIGLLGRFL